MMKPFFREKSLLVLIIVLFFLTGCLSDLEKPTGLENDSEPHIENHESKNKQVSEKKSIASADENNESKKDDNKETKNSDDPAKQKEQHDKQTVGVDENKESEYSNRQSRGKKVSSSKQKSTSNNNKSSDTSQKTRSSTHDSNNNSNSKNKSSKNEGGNNKGNNNSPPPPREEPTKPTITQSIVIAEEGSYGQKVCLEKKYKSCPEDGRAEIPLPPTTMGIEEEITVLEALIEITMAKNIHMDYRGGQGATAYVQGMGNVYEFDRGQGSGWMFRVNGIFPDRGAGVVPLCDGDVVEWLYTTNLGQDLNADLKPFRRDGACP